MKTLKVLFVLLFVLGMAVNNVEGQVKTSETIPASQSVYIPCFDEDASGDVVITITTWANKLMWQFKLKGELIGEETGNVYEISAVSNFAIGGGDGYVQMAVVTYNGTVFLHHKVTMQLAYDANGNLKAVVLNDFWDDGCN